MYPSTKKQFQTTNVAAVPDAVFTMHNPKKYTTLIFIYQPSTAHQQFFLNNHFKKLRLIFLPLIKKYV